VQRQTKRKTAITQILQDQFRDRPTLWDEFCWSLYAAEHPDKLWDGPIPASYRKSLARTLRQMYPAIRRWKLPRPDELPSGLVLRTALFRLHDWILIDTFLKRRESCAICQFVERTHRPTGRGLRGVECQLFLRSPLAADRARVLEIERITRARWREKIVAAHSEEYWFEAATDQWFDLTWERAISGIGTVFIPLSVPITVLSTRPQAHLDIEDLARTRWRIFRGWTFRPLRWKRPVRDKWRPGHRPRGPVLGLQSRRIWLLNEHISGPEQNDDDLPF
jgi:hypothetical protein